MLIRKILVITIIFIIFLPLSGMAVRIRDINIAFVNVPDQSDPAFQKALPQALEQVLIRMSGNTDVMTLPAIQNVLSQISRYIEKYSYITKIEDNRNNQLLLRVAFNQQAIRQLLYNANQTIWSINRPLMMIWLSIPNGIQPQILTNDSQKPVVQIVKQVAFVRGIPIIFPMMDLEDQIYMVQPPSTLPNSQQLQEISQRYEVNSTLSGTVIANKEYQLQGEWQLFLNETLYGWQTSGSNITEVVKNGIDRAVDMIINQFATLDSRGMESLVTIQVSGIKTLNDYVNVISTLKHLTLVTKISVSDINTDMLLLKITTTGNLNDLVKALKSISYLVAETVPTQTTLNVTHLFYRWKKDSMSLNLQTPLTLSNFYSLNNARSTTITSTFTRRNYFF